MDEWREYQKLVLSELRRHNEFLEECDKSINGIKLELAMLNVKSGVWGLLGGIIPVLILIALDLLKK